MRARGHQSSFMSEEMDPNNAHTMLNWLEICMRAIHFKMIEDASHSSTVQKEDKIRMLMKT